MQGGYALQFIGWVANVSYALDKWVVDGTVNFVAALGRMFGRVSAWIDKQFVDGMVNFTGIVTDMVGDLLKFMQTGRVQNYLIIAIAGVALFAFWFLIR